MTGRRWFSTALAVGAALVLAAPAGAQIPTQDSLTGSGPLFTVAITSGPSGENPTGSFTADAFGAHFQTTSISCLAVSGNVATFAAPVEPNALGVTFIKLTFVDNGSGPFIDTLANTGTTSPLDCVSPIPGGAPIRGRCRGRGRPAAADLNGAVQGRQLAELRRLHEPGRLRELRGHRR